MFDSVADKISLYQQLKKVRDELLEYKDNQEFILSFAKYDPIPAIGFPLSSSVSFTENPSFWLEQFVEFFETQMSLIEAAVIINLEDIKNEK